MNGAAGPSSAGPPEATRHEVCAWNAVGIPVVHGGEDVKTESKRMAEKGDVLMNVCTPVGDLNIALESCCIGRGLAAVQSIGGYQSFVIYTMFSLKHHMDVFNGYGIWLYQ